MIFVIFFGPVFDFRECVWICKVGDKLDFTPNLGLNMG